MLHALLCWWQVEQLRGERSCWLNSKVLQQITQRTLNRFLRQLCKRLLLQCFCRRPRFENGYRGMGESSRKLLLLFAMLNYGLGYRIGSEKNFGRC